MTAIRDDEPTTAALRADVAATHVLDWHLLRQQVGSAIEGYRLGCETDGLPTLTDTVDDIISTVLSAPKITAPADRAVVTEAMVNAACNAFRDQAYNWRPENRKMRIAIEAALRAAPVGADTTGEGE